MITIDLNLEYVSQKKKKIEYKLKSSIFWDVS